MLVKLEVRNVNRCTRLEGIQNEGAERLDTERRSTKLVNPHEQNKQRKTLKSCKGTDSCKVMKRVQLMLLGVGRRRADKLNLTTDIIPWRTN